MVLLILLNSHYRILQDFNIKLRISYNGINEFVFSINYLINRNVVCFGFGHHSCVLGWVWVIILWVGLGTGSISFLVWVWVVFGLRFVCSGCGVG